MRHHGHTFQSIASLAVVLLVPVTSTTAQSLLVTDGIVVASSNDTIPDNAGAPIAGLTFGSSSPFDSPVVDDAGHVYFRAQFQGSGLNTWDDRAFFYGTSRSDLKMHVRGGDQAPGLGTGVLLRSSLGSSSTLANTVQIASNGSLYWGVLVFDQPGTNGITSANDDLIFGGPFSGPQTILVQQGTQCPGAAPLTVFAQAFSSPSQQNTGLNASGHIYFQATTSGGDTNLTAGMNNQQGIWAGLPGSLELVVRKSNPVSGLGGAVAIDTGATLGVVTQINPSGKLFYEAALSTTQGAPVAVPADDRAYMVHTPGLGSAKLLREGDVAPGTTGATFNTITGAGVETWGPGFGANTWTRSGETLFSSTLRGGDVVGTTNDLALFKGGVGTLSLAARKGAVAPGTDATFLTFNNSSLTLNDNGRICFQATVAGGTSTTANDIGLWAGAPGALQLVAREGSVMPGTGGSLCGNFGGAVSISNDTNRVLFSTNLTGGGNPGASWWTWSPATGLRALIKNGDQIEVQPGVFKTASGALSSVISNNGDGAPKNWSNSGQFAANLTLTDGSRAIVRLHLPAESVTTSFCLGDGSGAACPCANPGAAGNGCASSAFAAGAHLASTGFAGASLATDTFVLTATNIPGPGLFFQSDSTTAAQSFGDGHMCTASAIVRLGVVFADALNTASYPGGLTPNPIHIAGAPIVAGDLKHYQCWYRSQPSLCGAGNYNLTQGLSVTWGP